MLFPKLCSIICTIQQNNIRIETFFRQHAASIYGFVHAFVSFVRFVLCVQNNPCMLPSLISGIFVIQEAAAPKQGVEFCQKCGGWCEI